MPGFWDTPPTAAELAGDGFWDTPPTAAELAGDAAPAPGAGEAFARGGAQGVTLGFNDEIEGAVQAAGRKLLPESLGGGGEADAQRPFGDLYREQRDAARGEYSRAEEAHPGAYVAGNVAGGLLLGGAASPARGIAAAAQNAARLGAAQGFGTSNADLTQGDVGGAALDTAVGGAFGAGAAGAVGGASKLMGAAARKLLPRAQAVEQRLEGALAARASKEAIETAQKKQGSYGAARADASRAIDLLERKAGLTPDEILLNEAALAAPEGQAVASQLAAKTRGELSEKLGLMDKARKTMEEAAAAVPEAHAYGKTTEYAWKSFAGRGKDQAGRYIIPAAAGLAGAALGPDDHRGLSSAAGLGLGMAAGRGVSPAVRAVVGNLILGPEVRRAAATAGVSLLQHLAKEQPSALGKFGVILGSALQRGGVDAFHAHSYVLGQTDPEFQEFQRQLNEGDQR